MKKTVFVETYGCQMNEYDTELVRSILANKGYSFTKDELAADIVMLNTCAMLIEECYRSEGRETRDAQHQTSIFHRPSSIANRMT